MTTNYKKTVPNTESNENNQSPVINETIKSNAKGVKEILSIIEAKNHPQTYSTIDEIGETLLQQIYSTIRTECDKIAVPLLQQGVPPEDALQTVKYVVEGDTENLAAKFKRIVDKYTNRYNYKGSSNPADDFKSVFDKYMGKGYTPTEALARTFKWLFLWSPLIEHRHWHADASTIRTQCDEITETLLQQIYSTIRTQCDEIAAPLLQQGVPPEDALQTVKYIVEGDTENLDAKFKSIVDQYIEGYKGKPNLADDFKDFATEYMSEGYTPTEALAITLKQILSALIEGRHFL